MSRTARQIHLRLTIGLLGFVTGACSSSSSTSPSVGTPTTLSAATVEADATTTQTPATAAPDTAAPETGPPITETLTTDAPGTDIPGSNAPDTSAGAPAAPWSETAAANYAEITAAITGGADPHDVLSRLFGNPLAVTLPADATLSAALVHVQRENDGFDVQWRFSVDTATDPATLEAGLATFADDRFEAGTRVVSTLTDGVFVTLNYPATTLGTGAGWATTSLVVGPQTSYPDPARPTELEMTAEQNVTEAPSLAPFLMNWLAEMPVADGLQLQSIDGQLVRLSTDSVNLAATFTADARKFADLVAFYAADHTGGNLVLDANPPPTDLSTIDRFNAGFFPTLAGYPIFATVSRDLTDPASPVTVELSIRLDTST